MPQIAAVIGTPDSASAILTEATRANGYETFYHFYHKALEQPRSVSLQ